MSRISILSIFTFLLFLPSFLIASPIINTEDHPSAVIEMKEMVPDHHPSRLELKELKKGEQHLIRIENRIVRMNKMLGSERFKNSLGGINDPVDRWFWIWIITWGFGLLLTVIFGGSLTGATLGIVWLLAFAIGSVSLVIWLVKKFG